MTTAEKLIANTSYTNKDFQSIYPALLDLVKKITYRWDPSISNESDPGVILLKLNAIIADKCNYNIDKNVLECFPLSVTQLKNARQLYEQLGYYMHWYNSATFGVSDSGTQDTYVSLRWIGETGNNSIIIPKFSMITDVDSSVVYTLTNETSLPLDGSYTNFEAMQGIATNYYVNGSTLITVANLDSNNRLYFDYTDIAQNGIFITNTGMKNYTSWNRVDNLLIQPVAPDVRVYKFGVTQDTNTCYIEFPVNAQEIIGEGINITYLRTLGEAGNIAPYVLEKFYNDITVVDNGTEILLNSDNVQIANFFPSIDGQEPEGIDEAYDGYKRVVGTFDTLVTLRDYINAAINSPNVSNAIVSDRNNDIQVSYDIITFENGINQSTNVVEDDLMSPFDIKFYALYAANAADRVYNAGQYNDTFKFIDELDNSNPDFTLVSNLKAYMDDQKHISNDYSFLLDTNSPDEYETLGKYKYANRMCLIKNMYPISGTIVPQYKLTAIQIADIRQNVQLAILQALNANKVNFGEEIDYDYVYSVIKNADERIKTVVLNDITYETYAVYLKVDNNTQADAVPEFIEVRIDAVDEQYPELSKELRTDIVAKSVLAGTTQFFEADKDISPQIGQDWHQILPGEYTLPTTRVTTDLNKQFTFDANTDTYTYTVGPNETISLFAENLIDVTEYTSYVRYEYKLNNDVLANQSYMLSGDEHVAFYWNGDIDSGYAYAAYGAGSIIKPSFNIMQGEIENFPVPISNQLNAATEPKYVKGYTYTFSDQQTAIEEHVTELSNLGCVLSTSKYITIQITNKIELNHDDFWCSWILNRTEDGEAVLFDENVHSYRLKTGEYFLYTNSTRTSLVVLGAGTVIQRADTWNEPWSCAVYDYESVISEGITSVVTTPAALQRVKRGELLTVTEMQYIALNEGASLRLTTSGGTIANPPLIKSLDGSGYYEYEFNDSGIVKIEYKGKNESAFTEIPMLTVNSSSWKLSSVLNINMSMNSPQNVTKGQIIILNDDEARIAPDDNMPEVLVSSSVPVVLEGGVNVDATTTYLTGEVVIPNISYYSVFDSSDDVAYTESGVVGIRLTDSVPSQELELHLPPGKYVIAFRHGNTNVRDLTLSYNNTPLHGVGNNETNLEFPKTYYLELNIDTETANQTLVLTAGSFSATNVEDNFSILECYRYNLADIIPEEDGSTDIYNRILELNKNFMFDFTYTVDEDTEIENPLDSMSFFDPNHIYNAYTIGQLITDSLDNIFITNKLRS